MKKLLFRAEPTRFCILLIGLLGGIGFCETSHANSFVLPIGNASVEGNMNNSAPFNITPFGLNQERYQQVYNSPDFGLTGPVLITQIAFRPDGPLNNGSAFSSTLPNVQINFSTTAAAADGLSTTFSNNVGLNDTVVFSGALSLSSAYTGPVGGPKDFDIIINLSTPFLFDPTTGNLLMDVRNFGGGSSMGFDAEDTVGDSVSRVFGHSDNVNEQTGFVSDSLGLITRFTTEAVGTAVPDSIPWWMGDATLVGLIFISLVHHKRQAC